MSALQNLSMLAGNVQPGAAIRLTELSSLVVLEAKGADTVDFLHGQLTQDVKTLDTGNARLAGYCTAKGRMLASTVVWRAAPALDDPTPRILLMVDAGLAGTLQKRLSMFVLRAKVKITALALHVIGVSASGAGRAALEAAVGALPHSPWTRTDHASGSWIAAPAADGQARWWWIASEDQIAATAPALGTIAAQSPLQAWQADDIAAGLPWISAATQDLFVPQTVNFELIGGVSFTKGCYPGQEIVARSHYLGKLKRRMFLGYISAQSAPAGELAAVDIYHSDDPQPCGRIVNAAMDQDKIALLFESTLVSVQAGTLHVGALDGPIITLQPLPYSLPGDKEA